jgi:hypothetical protein
MAKNQKENDRSEKRFKESEFGAAQCCAGATETPGVCGGSMKQMNTRTSVRDSRPPGVATRIMAGVCHRCGICPYAAKKPSSNLNTVMRWHRSWCPAWKAHTRVYGEKSLA